MTRLRRAALLGTQSRVRWLAADGALLATVPLTDQEYAALAAKGAGEPKGRPNRNATWRASRDYVFDTPDGSQHGAEGDAADFGNGDVCVSLGDGHGVLMFAGKDYTGALPNITLTRSYRHPVKGDVTIVDGELRIGATVATAAVRR